MDINEVKKIISINFTDKWSSNTILLNCTAAAGGPVSIRNVAHSIAQNERRQPETG